MKVGEVVILARNTGYKGKIYGRKDEKVKIISISGNAVIFENEKGNRYPCNIKDFK